MSSLSHLTESGVFSLCQNLTTVFALISSPTCANMAYGSSHADTGSLAPSWVNICPGQQAGTAVSMLLEFFCSQWSETQYHIVQ